MGVIKYLTMDELKILSIPSEMLKLFNHSIFTHKGHPTRSTTPLLEQQQQKKKLLRHCGWFGRKKMTIYIANYQSKRGELKFMRVRENDPRVNITVID